MTKHILLLVLQLLIAMTSSITCADSTHDAQEKWKIATPLLGDQDIKGVWVYTENPPSKAEIRFNLSDDNRGTYSVAARTGEATGVPMQYKVSNSTLYWRANILTNLQSGEWPYSYEVKKMNDSLLILDKGNLKEFKKFTE